MKTCTHPEVKLGEMAERNAAFVCLTTKPHKHYAGSGIGEAEEAVVLPLMLMVVRWDASFGFPGGNVDGDETLVEAAVRELQEEIGHIIIEEDLTLVVSHAISDTMNSHLFHCEVSPEEIYAIQRSAPWGEHSSIESMGCLVLHLTPDVLNRLRNEIPKAKTVAEELTTLIGLDII